ncbi:MAG: formate dehydrogenase subunit gamma [Alphaproteobacteria bacterium]
MTQYIAWEAATASALIAERKALPGALLPILHALSDTFGYVDKSAVGEIADALNLSRAEVHGVITFYHDFRREPPGHHVIKICRAEACQSMSCNALVVHAKKTLGIDFHETSPNRRFTLEPVYCLGNCALAPSVTIDEEVHGRVTPDRFDDLVAQLVKA